MGMKTLQNVSVLVVNSRSFGGVILEKRYVEAYVIMLMVVNLPLLFLRTC